MRVEDTSELYAYIRPEIEFGGEFTTHNALRVRPTMTLAVTKFFGNPETTATTQFATSVGTAAPFQSVSSLDDTRAEVALGIEVLGRNNMVFSLKGYGTASENSNSLGVAARISIPF